jgi:hypothetical protein
MFLDVRTVPYIPVDEESVKVFRKYIFEAVTKVMVFDLLSLHNLNEHVNHEKLITHFFINQMLAIDARRGEIYQAGSLAGRAHDFSVNAYLQGKKRILNDMMSSNVCISSQDLLDPSRSYLKVKSGENVEYFLDLDMIKSLVGMESSYTINFNNMFSPTDLNMFNDNTIDMNVGSIAKYQMNADALHNSTVELIEPVLAQRLASTLRTYRLFNYFSPSNDAIYLNRLSSIENVVNSVRELTNHGLK